MASPPPNSYPYNPQDQTQYQQYGGVQPQYGQPQYSGQPQYGQPQYSGQQAGQPGQQFGGVQPGQERQPLQLSAEERKVMQDCNSEAFYYRGLPLSTLLMGGVQVLVKQGKLRANPRFGSAPKVMLAGFFGYIMGKVSYTEVCCDKMLNQVPRGQLSALIRKRRGMPELEPLPQESQDYGGLGVPQDEAGRQTPASQQQVSSAPPSTLSGYDEFRRQNRETAQPLPQTPQQPLSGYDELRRRNRDMAGAPSPSQYQPPPPPPPGSAPPPEVTVIAPPPPLYSPPPPRSGGSKNKYGDEGFE